MDEAASYRLGVYSVAPTRCTKAEIIHRSPMETRTEQRAFPRVPARCPVVSFSPPDRELLDREIRRWMSVSVT